MNVFDNYFNSTQKQIAILVDPDKHTPESAAHLARKIDSSRANMIFVGGSLVSNSVYDIIDAIKSVTNKPVILFPGSPHQISSNADALLLLSLVSGRNPQYLIGDAVSAAMTIKKSGLETIPTAYILIDGGKCTSVQYVSNTMPIPADKVDIAVSTAVASTLLGMKAIYLEAGSGALNPVSAKIISAVKQNTDVALIVGGGLRSQVAIQQAFAAGADIVVVGSAVENDEGFLDQCVF
ncbi:MAG: geranylgeranylglyceryl/heptaprenylglyceryl phosphate synthase [Bacteroidales bacterium]|nr:geranylgeranylglyceryl/heptaprenylglyceryl phosphate synthase [Bacteroidales bacterium]